MNRSTFLTLKYFAYSYPIDLITVLLTIAHGLNHGQAFLSWILITTIAHCAILPFIFIRTRQSKSIFFKWNEIGILIVAGIIRGSLINMTGSFFGYAPTHPWLLRPINSAIVVPIWFLVIHFIVDSRRSFNRKFNRRYAEAVTTITQNLEKDVSKSRENAGMVSEIENLLKPLKLTILELSGKSLSASDFARESERLIQFIQNQLRPTSHQMWESAKLKSPKIEFKRLVGLSLFELKLPLLQVAVVTFIPELVGAIALYEFGQGARRTIINFLTLTAIGLMYHWIIQRLTIPTRIANSIALISSTVIPPIVTHTVPSILINPRTSITVEILNAVAYLGILYAFALAVGIHRYEGRVFEVFDLFIEDLKEGDNQHQLQAIERGKFARYLHADIQSSLIASSIELSRAASKNDYVLADQAIMRTAHLLRRDHREYIVGQKINYRKRIQEIIDSWSGIADITFEGLELIIDSAESVLSVAEIFGEIVANAVRHGHASKIGASLKRSGDLITIVVNDNGDGNFSTRRGMGTAILDSRSEHWHSEVLESGNRVEFSLRTPS